MDIERLSKLYRSGESFTSLGERFGINRKRIKKLLQAHDVPLRQGSHALYPEQEDEVCRLYQEGISSPEIGQQFGVHPQTVVNILERRGIDRRWYSPYILAHPRFFCNIDQEPKAYWLGFLTADGCITGNGNRLQVALQRQDRSHLVRLREALGADNPILDQEYNGHKSSKFAVSSEQLTQCLEKNGVYPANTYDLFWPSLPDSLVHHFIRGFIDGDGGFYVSENKYTHSNNYVFAVDSASVEFLLSLQTCLIEHCDLSKPNLRARNDKPDASRRLIYCGRLQVKRIFNYLYNGATVWLPRKRDKIEPHL